MKKMRRNKNPTVDSKQLLVAGVAVTAMSGLLAYLTYRLGKAKGAETSQKDMDHAANAMRSMASDLQHYAPQGPKSIAQFAPAPSPPMPPTPAQSPVYVLWTAYAGAREHPLPDNEVIWEETAWGDWQSVQQRKTAAWDDLYPVVLSCIRLVSDPPLTRGYARVCRTQP